MVGIALGLRGDHYDLFPEGPVKLDTSSVTVVRNQSPQCNVWGSVCWQCESGEEDMMLGCSWLGLVYDCNIVSCLYRGVGVRDLLGVVGVVQGL